ncbi:MAG TPA: hypothetical protein VJK52_02250 [Candidatus Nanoarchaeia archaeon]|nr:hypothetical protein [Candidatus Nanoarchaeia archaeon]
MKPLLVVGIDSPLWYSSLSSDLRRNPKLPQDVVAVRTHEELETALEVRRFSASVVALDQMPVLGRRPRDQIADRCEIIDVLRGHGPVLLVEGRNTALSLGIEGKRYQRGAEYMPRFHSPVAAYAVTEKLRELRRDGFL